MPCFFQSLEEGELSPKFNVQSWLSSRSGLDFVHLKKPSLIGFCPVSTYSIGSVERVARALRWGLLGTDILSYPPTVHAPLQNAHYIAGQSSWMRQADKANHYCVCRPPSDYEAADFKQRINEAKKTTGSTKASRRLVSKLDDLDREVQGAIFELGNLLSCPVCAQPTEIVRSGRPSPR